MLFTEKEEPGSGKIGGGADDPGGSIAARGTLGWWKLQLKPVQCLGRAAAVAAGWHCGGQAHGGRNEGTDTAGHAAGRTASTAIILLVQARGTEHLLAPSPSPTATTFLSTTGGFGVQRAVEELAALRPPIRHAHQLLTTRRNPLTRLKLHLVTLRLKRRACPPHRSALLQPAPMLPLSQCGRRKTRIRHPTSRCATWRFLHRAHKDGPFSTSQKRRTTLLSIWHQFAE